MMTTWQGRGLTRRVGRGSGAERCAEGKRPEKGPKPAMRIRCVMSTFLVLLYQNK